MHHFPFGLSNEITNKYTKACGCYLTKWETVQGVRILLRETANEAINIFHLSKIHQKRATEKLNRLKQNVL